MDRPSAYVPLVASHESFFIFLESGQIIEKRKHLATYALPIEYREAIKRLSYRDLEEHYGLRQEAISRVIKQGVISEASYPKLVVFLRDLGIKPFEWDEIVETSVFYQGKLRGDELFQEIRRLYHQGRGELAISMGRRGLTHRHADVWFYSGWGLLSVANRIGKADDFVAVITQLRPKLDRIFKVPPEHLRGCACDIAKWLLENNAASQAFDFYAPLMTYFEPRIEKMPALVGSSILRGYGTLNLMRRRYEPARRFYAQSLQMSGTNPEAETGVFNWLCQEYRSNPTEIQQKRSPWEGLSHLLADSRDKPMPPGVSVQTFVSARLISCLNPEIEANPVQFDEVVDDCAAWIRRVHPDIRGFIIPGTPLADIARRTRSESARRTILPLIRRPLSNDSLNRVTEFLRRLMDLIGTSD